MTQRTPCPEPERIPADPEVALAAWRWPSLRVPGVFYTVALLVGEEDPPRAYWDCTCPGFTYRDACRHVERAKLLLVYELRAEDRQAQLDARLGCRHPLTVDLEPTEEDDGFQVVTSQARLCLGCGNFYDRGTVTVADLFCGAGGSSTGAARALEELGLTMDLVAVNHWAIAVATHQANHPEARHFNTNIYKLSPREAVPSGRLDLLLASPTCIYNSKARGGKPISWDQRWGRMTPSQVLRWLGELDVERLVVENVPEFVQWRPVHPGPRMEDDGETVRVPAPPIRNERCLRARCEPGKPCKLKRCDRKRPCGRGPGCSPRNPCNTGTYFRRFVRRIEALGYVVSYRVLNAADFGDPTTRERLFVVATRSRFSWPVPTHSKDGASDLFSETQRWVGARTIIDPKIRGTSIFKRKKRLSDKTLKRILAGLIRFRWPWPYIATLQAYIDRKPLPKFTAEELAAAGIGEPFVFQANQGHDRARNMRTTDEPLPTVVTRTFLGYVEPLVVRTDMHKSNALCVRSINDPIATVTTGGGFAFVEPFVVGNRTNNTGKALDEPAPTFTTATGGGVAVVEPFLVPQGGGGVARSLEDPLPTVATDGAHGLVVPYYGNGACRPVDAPLPTVTTKDRFAFVVPVTHGGKRRARALDEPLPTVTAAHRGELAFIVAAFGERKGQRARVHSIDDPAPTLCAQGRLPIVQADPVEIDILYRMAEPHELAAGMGFPRDYVFVHEKKEDLTRQIGNAVAVGTAAALVRALFAPAARNARARKAALPA